MNNIKNTHTYIQIQFVTGNWWRVEEYFIHRQYIYGIFPSNVTDLRQIISNVFIIYAKRIYMMFSDSKFTNGFHEVKIWCIRRFRSRNLNWLNYYVTYQPTCILVLYIFLSLSLHSFTTGSDYVQSVKNPFLHPQNKTTSHFVFGKVSVSVCVSNCEVNTQKSFCKSFEALKTEHWRLKMNLAK